MLLCRNRFRAAELVVEEDARRDVRRSQHAWSVEKNGNGLTRMGRQRGQRQLPFVERLAYQAEFPIVRDSAAHRGTFSSGGDSSTEAKSRASTSATFSPRERRPEHNRAHAAGAMTTTSNCSAPSRSRPARAVEVQEWKPAGLRAARCLDRVAHHKDSSLGNSCPVTRRQVGSTPAFQLVATSPSRPLVEIAVSIQIVVCHQPASGLGDRSGTATGKRPASRQLVDGDPVLHGPARSAESVRRRSAPPPRRPMITPADCRQKSLTKTLPQPGHLRSRIRPQRSMTVRSRHNPSSIIYCDTPTAAISGLVKTVAATVRNRIGLTPSPSACHMAIRPCIAATDASGSRPVQSRRA